MRHYKAFCVAHDRQWQADYPAEDCPWCEVVRLREFEEAIANMLGYLIPETGEMASHSTMLETIGHLKYAASFYTAKQEGKR